MFHIFTEGICGGVIMYCFDANIMTPIIPLTPFLLSDMLPTQTLIITMQVNVLTFIESSVCGSVWLW